jgi:hypothetical protein
MAWHFKVVKGTDISIRRAQKHSLCPAFETRIAQRSRRKAGANKPKGDTAYALAVRLLTVERL